MKGPAALRWRFGFVTLRLFLGKVDGTLDSAETNRPVLVWRLRRAA
jgi:hypothetical protein